MRIGELAKATGCPPETIRFYEQKGLVPPPSRLDNNYRVYGAAHMERLYFIRRCRALGMSLDEIAALLGFRDRPDAPCDGVNELLDRHIDEVHRQIRELEALQADLVDLRSRCHVTCSTSECQILMDLATVPAAR